MAKNPPDNAGEAGLIPGSGRSTGEGNWYHSGILENPMDRGACGLQSTGPPRVGHN